MGFLKKLILFSLFLFFIACNKGINNEFEYIEISRENYTNKLYGFWLGQSIANWTGLITEMDKIGNLGEIKTGLKKYLKSILLELILSIFSYKRYLGRDPWRS